MQTLRSPRLEALALALVVRTQGHWTPDARAPLEAELRAQGVGDPAALEALLARARERYAAGEVHLFLCDDEACRQASAETPLGREAGAPPQSLTACQGCCDWAPVATLRVGDRCETFGPLRGPHARALLAAGIRRASCAGTLLIDLGDAEGLRVDPVHDPDPSTPGADPLAPLRFLVGHFRGEGCYASDGGWFHKEMIGSRVARGRFLTLTLAVTYELDDGRKDRHEALVVLGADDGGLVARAYSDSGRVDSYPLERTREGIRFGERLRGHGGLEVRARKSLEPCGDGIVERVERVEPDGRVRPHSSVTLRRVAS